MFTHTKTIDTTHSIYQLKSNLVDNMYICNCSNESFVFYEKLFWTTTFLRPMVKCIKKNKNTIELSFYLRKVDKILLSLYWAMGSIISLSTILMKETGALPFMIILWLTVASLLFWIYFKINCNRITKKIISLLQ